MSDFILGISLVYSEKFIQKIGLLYPQATFNKNNIGNFIFSNTMPREINYYFRKLGISIEHQGYYLGDKENIVLLQEIEKAVHECIMPIIFDNHLISFGQTQNFLYAITGIHFITIHSFELDIKNGVVNYSFWDYGSVKNNPYERKDYRPEWMSSLKKQMKHSKKVSQSGKPEFYKNEITFEKFLKAMKGY